MVRRRLEHDCVGKKILRTTIIDDGILDHVGASRLARTLKNRTITSAERRGKQLFLGIESGTALTIHLGLTGDLECLKPPEGRTRWARLVLDLDDGSSMVYTDLRKFGAIGLTRSMDEFVSEHNLGPDALDVDAAEFVRRVRSHKRAIKAVLLDQHVVAGVGNLYADEALFQSKLHPLTIASEISKRKTSELHSMMQMVLRTSIDAETDFEAFPPGFLLRHRARGAECPRGNGRLVVIEAAGRTTILCPKCQRRKR